MTQSNTARPRAAPWWADRIDTATLEAALIDHGLLDDGQPTEAAHLRHVEAMEADFTPRERRLIRAALGVAL